MKNKIYFFFLLVIVLYLPVNGQLQQSGGPGSAVTATQTGTWTVQPGNTANTTAWKVDGSAVTQPISGTVTINAIPTGSNVIGTVNTIPKTSCGNTIATGSMLAAIPTVATLVTTAATACIVRVVFNNTNATPATVTLTDNTGTPINALLAFSIPGNSNLILPLDGIAFNLGVKWNASATLVTGAILAFQ